MAIGKPPRGAEWGGHAISILGPGRAHDSWTGQDFQLNLFHNRRKKAEPLPTHRGDPPASRDAASRARERAASDRAAVMGALQLVGPYGATAFELDEALGWNARNASGSPAGKRLSELLRMPGATVARLRATRESPGGGQAHVHVLQQYAGARETLPASSGPRRA